ncbi:hypothetical protein BKA70DRAFT_1474993 [Coprinopsis sp. MPI-PUGE-AT-0042]|nr:hypothetical protein BKA70DRAFT_1474993 [Coprinopsis sp. MPI-PUGE-AT-0042]
MIKISGCTLKYALSRYVQTKFRSLTRRVIHGELLGTHTQGIGRNLLIATLASRSASPDHTACYGRLVRSSHNMPSRSSSYRSSQRPSPQPHLTSGSRSRNRETMERRHQSTRGRSRSRSPRHERWASNPPGGWHSPPRSDRSRMRSRTPPPRMSRHRSYNYQYEDRHGRGGE